MVQAIIEITVDAGIDPRGAVLVGGGGAAGLNSGAIMRRLGCRALVIPEAGAALSAVGALMADLSADFAEACFTSTEAFDGERVDAVLASLRGRCTSFAEGVGVGGYEIDLIAEARLARQVWQIDVPLRTHLFGENTDAVETLVADFRRLHEEIFAVRDEESPVEVVALRARVTCTLEDRSDGRFAGSDAGADGEREVYFPGHGTVTALVRSLGSLAAGDGLPGPALVESPLSTIVIEPGTVAERRPGGGLIVKTIEPGNRRKEGQSDVDAATR
jgi:N-methylhydantoinase A